MLKRSIADLAWPAGADRVGAGPPLDAIGPMPSLEVRRRTSAASRRASGPQGSHENTRRDAICMTSPDFRLSSHTASLASQADDRVAVFRY